MPDLEHARQMLAMARNDLKALQGMLDQETFTHEIFGFHAQQAVEKALKSWIIALGLAYPKIHDLDELFVVIKEQKEPIPEGFKSLAGLTHFAVQFRYEIIESQVPPFGRQETISQVSAFLEHVKARLDRVEKKIQG